MVELLIEMSHGTPDALLAQSVKRLWPGRSLDPEMVHHIVLIVLENFSVSAVPCVGNR